MRQKEISTDIITDQGDPPNPLFQLTFHFEGYTF